MRIFAASALLILVGFAAQACPDMNAWGRQSYTGTGDDLFQPRQFGVQAGGDYSLTRCGIRAKNYRGALPGYVIAEPDFTFKISQLRGYSLQFRVIGACDTVLLINTGVANWYFDDDDLGRGDAVIELTSPSEGLYDVWVGTYEPTECDAILEVETF